MASSESNHPYHLVNPSKWPFVGSLAGFIMATGGIYYMHDGSIFAFLAGTALMLYVMYSWWSDVISEAEGGLDHTSVVKHGLRVGMVLFITSEVMFFFAFFWAFFDATVPLITRTAHEIWPPEGVVPFAAFGIPFLNTLILLTSGATVTVAHHKIVHGDRAGSGRWLAYTVMLGLIFTSLQAYEYVHATFGFTDGIYSSTFYLATGFHGFHVIVGTLFLLVCYFRTQKGHFTADTHIGFEAAAWYWHFVDVVWLFLFVCIYWWGGSGYVPAS